MAEPPEPFDGCPPPEQPSRPVTAAPVSTTPPPVPRDQPPLVSQPPSGPAPERRGDANAFAPDG